MHQNLIRLGTRKPRTVYLIMLALTLVLGLQIPRIVIDTDPENMLPSDQSDRLFHNEVKETFALHDAIVVGMVNETHPHGIYNPGSLNRLNTLTGEVLRIDGVIRQDLMALGTVDNIEQAGPGTVSFQWLMRDAPKTLEQSEAIRKAVERLPMFMNTLVSDDGRAAAVYVPIADKDESYRISGEIAAIADRLQGEDDFYITGLPVAEDTFGFEMFVQMGISAPLAALVIMVLMWIFFRNIRLILAPMIMAMATVISTMGLLIGLGYTVHIMSSMIPIFLMPIAVVDSIHVLSEFADSYRPGLDRREVITEVIRDLFRPMLFTSITSAIGFLSLALTPIPPVQVFGIFVAFGILLAFVLTILFIPAYVCRMRSEQLLSMQQAVHGSEKDSVLARMLRRGGRLAARRAPWLLAVLAVVFGFSVLGITQIQINDNPVRWFKADHRIRVADRVLNAHFAGTYDAYFVFEAADASDEARGLAQQLAGEADALGEGRDVLLGAVERIRQAERSRLSEVIAQVIGDLDDASWSAQGAAADGYRRAVERLERFQQQSKVFSDPDVLRYITRFQAAMQESGQVGKTHALPDLVKTVNRELRGGEAEDYRLPDTGPAVAQTLLQFQSSHRPQDLWRLVTPDFRRAVVWVQLSSGDNQDMTAVIDAAGEFLAANPPPKDIAGRWAGKTYINVVWQEAMVAGMRNSLIGAFAIVLLMMIVLFRSMLFGVAAMLPLTITITFIYGLIGWVGKDYDMPIAVLSALTLGLSIDFAIHFLQRSRAIFARTGSFDQTMAEIFEEPARAIARNAIVIAVGFLPLLFAPLVPYITVGVFLAAIMAISGIVTLLMLPAVARILRDRLYPDATPASPAVTEPTT